MHVFASAFLLMHPMHQVEMFEQLQENSAACRVESNYGTSTNITRSMVNDYRWPDLLAHALLEALKH
jgi:hypothetical protein